MKRLFRILIVALLTTVPKAYATIAFVQAPAACHTGTSGTTLTCAFGSPTVAGHTLIGVVAPAGYPSSAYTVALSDNINGAWPAYTLQCYSSENAQINVFVLPSSASGTITVTATIGTSVTAINMAVAEYSGSSGTLDGTPSCSAVSYSDPAVSPTLTTTLNTDMIATGEGYEANSGIISVASPYTLRTGTGSAYQTGIADYLPGTSGSITGATFTQEFTGEAAYTFGMALKASGSAPSGGINPFWFAIP